MSALQILHILLIKGGLLEGPPSFSETIDKFHENLENCDGLAPNVRSNIEGLLAVSSLCMLPRSPLALLSSLYVSFDLHAVAQLLQVFIPISLLARTIQ